MKSSRFSEEQIIGILKQAQAGMKIVDLCRTHGISDVTFYKWCNKNCANDGDRDLNWQI